ncbi:hypothetical protein G7K_6238-t1 [Saitoella complicata NRRL Y-17804]|uniref:Uncharacterized protein n=1 Tax=Saitoella complicata (strain BCRC 22490 / CBS 7301 / JCM 7358 / NBRC 10748 / NRRL Y-17804) TaxID=698492 RepID=A0A0E9NQJ7_SAICN|nr:hypothetical protein G7K_6238-t1 [Saitoella complicata NRRL Y-17804]
MFAFGLCRFDLCSGWRSVSTFTCFIYAWVRYVGSEMVLDGTLQWRGDEDLWRMNKKRDTKTHTSRNSNKKPHNANDMMLNPVQTKTTYSCPSFTFHASEKTENLLRRS